MKQNITTFKTCLLLAGSLALAASCQDYEPANEQMTKEAAYNYEFERQFGPVDPNHDWSMATRVTANIDLSDAPEGTYEVKIFSEKNGYLLTKAIVENSAQISFDAIKGENSVRILARKTSALGLTPINGYFTIEDGVVSTASGTRAASTAEQCNTTVGDQIDLGTTTKQGEIAYVYHASTVDLSQSTVLSSLPTDDGIYYYTKIDGQSYADGDNGTYSVTHNGETSTMDMYQLGNYIYDDASANTTTKYYEETDPVYQFKAANGDYYATFVEELPSDGKYYIAPIDGEDYSDGADGKYSVTLNGETSQMTMHEIAPIIASNNFLMYKAETKTKTSSDWDWNHDWDNLPDTEYIDQGGWGYYQRTISGYTLAGGQYVTPAYYEITKAGGFSVLDTYMQAAHYQTTTENVTVGWAGNFYKLKDVYKSIDTETQVKFDDLLPLVSSSHPDPIFHETVDNRTKYEDVLDFNVELVLTEDGPMTYTYVFYGSIYHNMLGYFYWNETPGMTDAQKKQARINAPRYVLMDDTYPSEEQSETGKPNLQCYNDPSGTNAHTPGGMDMPTWVEGEGHLGHYMQGTTYHMAYFGQNYDQPASYTFPEGLHVAFFLITKAEGANAQTKGNGLFYSIQDMNEDQEVMTDGAGNKTILNNKHWWASQVGDTWDPSLERPNEGEVAAVFYSYKGSMVMGFEDDVDKDENDMLFLISAPVTPPIELSEEDEMTWIVACEDLGGTYDYDFNDLVFELTKDEITTHHIDPNTGEEVGEPTTTIEWFIRALAAGGTLPATVYYDNTAIGEIHSMLGSTDTGTPINVASGTTPSIGTLVKLENVAVADQNEISKVFPHIKIVVENKDENIQATVITAPNQDKTSNIPQMLLLPKGWDWPTEQTHIYNVYPKFKNWATDMTQNGWIENPSTNSINTSFFIVNPNK